jgi:hypothetical protein
MVETEEVRPMDRGAPWRALFPSPATIVTQGPHRETKAAKATPGWDD